eukprot:jgi/Chlat1/7387/Chrsp6S09188
MAAAVAGVAVRVVGAVVVRCARRKRDVLVKRQRLARSAASCNSRLLRGSPRLGLAETSLAAVAVSTSRSRSSSFHCVRAAASVEVEEKVALDAMAAAKLEFAGHEQLQDVLASDSIVFVGRKASLLAAKVVELLPSAVKDVFPLMVEQTSPGDSGSSSSSWFSDNGKARKVVAAVLPAACSRHNSPAFPHSVTSLVSGAAGKGTTGVVLVLEDELHAFAAGCAVGKAFPVYSVKSSGKNTDSDNGVAKPEEKVVKTAFVTADGSALAAGSEELKRIAKATEGIRLTQRLVEGSFTHADVPSLPLAEAAILEAMRLLPPAWMVGRAAAQDVDISSNLHIKQKQLDVKTEVIRGSELRDKGFGGLWGVGKAAVLPPALVILTYEPSSPKKTICLVGKGIVYDTGGLSIKPSSSMPGMKGDMAGAAATLAAFAAAVQLGSPHRLHCILCIAENAVGPEATRPDDVLNMYSGKTVEVNNTDAEGRLVLGDGVAYATRHLQPDTIIDMATLTGAQLIATGRKIAALVCNDDVLEQVAISAGKTSGDLTHPLPYVPEFFRDQFKSKIADMKNSVKDRMNAQSSCAGIFIAEHLDKDYKGTWLHVDIAGPAEADERGTGFGVALVLEILRQL